MLSNGFENSRNYDYINRNYGIILEDLHDENVLTQNGFCFYRHCILYHLNMPKPIIIKLISISLLIGFFFLFLFVY